MTWVSCFLAFMAMKMDQEEMRSLAAYGVIILQLIRKHGGSGWLLYDRQFRLQQEAGAGLPWTDINPSLLAVTILGQAGKKPLRSCQLCMAADHSRKECALASLVPHKTAHPTSFPSRPPPSCQARHPVPYRASGLCYRFNNGSNCHSASCRYEHACSLCFSPTHQEVSCLEKGGRMRSRQVHVHGDSKTGPTQARQGSVGDRQSRQ